MKSFRHTLAASALVAGIACGTPVHAQMGAGSGSGNVAATPGDARGLPAGAPGGQREPLTPLPDGTADDTRERPTSALSGIPVSNQGGGGTTMSDDAIHQSCMMKANPKDCRTRIHNGETDPSIERNPP